MPLDSNTNLAFFLYKFYLNNYHRLLFIFKLVSERSNWLNLLARQLLNEVNPVKARIAWP